MPLYGPPPKCPRTQRRAFQRYSEGRVEHFPIRKIQRNLGRIRIGCKVEDDRMRLRFSFYKGNLGVESRSGEVDEEPSMLRIAQSRRLAVKSSPVFLKIAFTIR